jgi:hypothetical protein
VCKYSQVLKIYLKASISAICHSTGSLVVRIFTHTFTVLMHDCHIQLLSGGSQDFDVDDLRNHTKYTGGYTESSRTVKLFWEVCVVVSSWSFNSMYHRSWVQTFI